MKQLLANRPELRLAGSLLIVLLAINLVLNPVRFQPGNLAVTLGLAAPLIIAAIASMPPILGGRGGIDISVGPLMGLVNGPVDLVRLEEAPASLAERIAAEGIEL